MPVLVYGMVRAGHPDPRDLPGVGGPAAPVRLVRSGQVAAAVSDVAGDTAGTESRDPDLAEVELRDTDAVGYLDVITALLPDGPVLPVRFGTVAPDDDSVRTEIIEPEHDLLTGRLDALDGLVEVKLDVVVDEDAGIRQAVAGDPHLRRLVERSQTNGALDVRIGLGEEISRALDARRGALTDRVLTDLGAVAVSHVVRLPDDVTVARYAFLVPAARLADVDDAVRRLRADLGDGYEIGYVGPLPAFDFIDSIEDAPGPQEPAHGRWGW
ncbi:GvpL/GvpF family gas vesicle protein [Planosporangium sp. 12N6]|uniref:GvpL/GvpF family gas vesicle protein n=1 Tax=Planosporangium spinosum TaxID=3402278 RepID=UPI003CEF2BB9